LSNKKTSRCQACGSTIEIGENKRILGDVWWAARFCNGMCYADFFMFNKKYDIRQWYRDKKKEKKKEKEVVNGTKK